MADWTGLEPATSGVTGRHSNQLNYQSTTLHRHDRGPFFERMVGGTGFEPVTPSL